MADRSAVRVRSSRVNYKEDKALAQFSDANVRYLATTAAFVPRLFLEQTRGAVKETLLQRLIAELEIEQRHSAAVIARVPAG
jgi:hypothetical protein